MRKRVIHLETRENREADQDWLDLEQLLQA